MTSKQIGAPAGNPLHGTPDQDAERTIPSGEDRLTRYAEAYYRGSNAGFEALMAMVNAEMVEVEVEIDTVTASLSERDRALTACNNDLGRDLSLLRAAEAKVARVEARRDEWSAELESGAIRDLDARDCWGRALREIRAALDGDA